LSYLLGGWRKGDVADDQDEMSFDDADEPQMLDEEVFSLMKNVLLTGRCWKGILYELKTLRNLQSIALSADLGVDLRVAGQTGKQHKS
jgi:hypothetical protein